MQLVSKFVLVASLVFAATACGNDAPKTSKAVAVSADEAADLLLNRNWMDLWPESETEKLRVFRFVPSMGGGVFQDRTLFKGSFELFTFEVDGTTLVFNLHHTKDKVRSTFRIERVDGPAPFDLKLSIDGSPRGPNVYFGRSSETVTNLALQPIE